MEMPKYLGGPFADLGTFIVKELVKNDGYNGLSGHGPDTHGGTHPQHEQFTVFRRGESGSGTNIRILRDE